jgi:WD40 repeat protein
MKALLTGLIILGAVVTAPPDLEPITALNVNQLTELHMMQDFENLGQIMRLAFNPDGTLLASEQAAASIRLWDAETGKLSVVLQHDGGDLPESLLFDPVHDVLAFWNYWDTVIWDWERGQSSTITDCYPLAFSPDGTTYLCSDLEADSLRLWSLLDSFNPEPLLNLAVNGWPVVFTPDGNQIVLPVLTLSGNVWVSVDQTLQVWDIETDAPQAAFPMFDLPHPFEVFEIRAMSLSSGGRFLAYSGFERKGDGSAVAVRDLTTGAFWSWLSDTGLYKWSTGLAFSPDESLLIFGTQDGVIHVADAAIGEEIASFASGDESVYAVAMSSDGTRLATGGSHGVIRLWGVPE